MIYIWCYALCRARALLTTRMPELWMSISMCAALALVWFLRGLLFYSYLKLSTGFANEAFIV
jgi:hypothetical protein